MGPKRSEQRLGMLPGTVRRHRIGRRMRALAAGDLRDGRRGGDSAATDRAAAAPAQLPRVPCDMAGARGQRSATTRRIADPAGSRRPRRRRPRREPLHTRLRDRRGRPARPSDHIVHEGPDRRGGHRGRQGGGDRGRGGGGGGWGVRDGGAERPVDRSATAAGGISTSRSRPPAAREGVCSPSTDRRVGPVCS